MKVGYFAIDFESWINTCADFSMTWLLPRPNPLKNNSGKEYSILGIKKAYKLTFACLS